MMCNSEQKQNIVMSNLMVSAIKLLHKRENEEFLLMCEYLQGRPSKQQKKSSTSIWFWGLRRWGKDWIEQEYLEHT